VKTAGAFVVDHDAVGRCPPQRESLLVGQPDDAPPDDGIVDEEIGGNHHEKTLCCIMHYPW
jgi:hypothetical protein